MEALRHKPAAFWLGDDATPLQDYSGYNRTATISGTAPTHLAVSSEATYAHVLSRANIATLASPVFRQGQESQPFSLGATLRVINRSENNAAQTYRENLVPNPSFEVNTTDWAATRTITRTADTATGSGSYAAHVTFQAVNDMFRMTQGATPVESGKTYTARLNIRSVTGSPPLFNLRIEWWGTQGGNFIGTSTGANFTPTDTSTEYKLTIEAPYNAAFANISLTQASTGTATLAVDSVGLFKGTDSTYFDGSFAGYEWTSTAELSRSRPLTYAEIAYRENLATNPSAEATTVTPWSGFMAAVVEKSADFAFMYSNTYKITWKSAANGGGTSQAMYWNIGAPVKPNTKYWFSFYARNATGSTAQLRADIGFRNAAQAYVAGGSFTVTNTVTTLTTTGWTRVIGYTTSPSDAAYLEPVVRRANGAPAADEVSYVDAVLIEAGDSLGTYFDGTLPDYEWAGTTNASISRSLRRKTRVNYVTNPSGVVNTSGWGGIGVDSSPVTRVADSSAPSGDGYLIRRTAAGNNSLGHGMTPTFWLPPGPYVASYWVRSNVGTAWQSYLEGSATKSPGALTHTALTANTWTRVSITFHVTAPGTVKVGGYTGSTMVAGNSIDITGAMLEPALTLRPYFNGNTAGAMWAGNTHESASFMLISNSEQQVIGHANTNDGLLVSGTEAHFVTKYTNTGEARCSYDFGETQVVNLYGVHSKEKNSLYVNDQLVAEVDISEVQQADTYSSATADLSSGSTESSQAIAINNIGIWPDALSKEDVASIYRASVRKNDGEVAKIYGGEYVNIASSVRPAYLEVDWNTEEHWQNATLHGVSVENDQLTAQFENSLTTHGFWIDSVDIYNGPTASLINSMTLYWSGKNETVEASLDGVTWTAVQSGINIPIVTTNLDPTNKALYIRVSFAAGKEEAYLDSMRVRGYLGNTATSGNRTITYANPAVIFDDVSPVDLTDNMGVRLDGGRLTIGPDTTSTNPTSVRTVEIWMKKTTADNASFSSNFGLANTYYSNGAVGTGYNTGEWTVRHFVWTADQKTETFFIEGNIHIGRIAFYPTALTAAQVGEIVSQYEGVVKTTETDSGSIAIAEPTTPSTMYSHDWQILTN